MGVLQSSCIKGIPQNPKGFSRALKVLHKAPRGLVRACLNVKAIKDYFPVSSYSKGIPAFQIDNSE